MKIYGFQSEELAKVKSELASQLFGPDHADNRASGLCIQCKLPALPRCYSKAGRKEFSISGLCEVCFDELFS